MIYLILSYFIGDLLFKLANKLKGQKTEYTEKDLNNKLEVLEDLHHNILKQTADKKRIENLIDIHICH